MRKTIAINEIVDRANEFFENSTCSPDGRAMMQCFVENILMSHKAYRGFGYIHGWPCDDPTRIHFYRPH